MPDSGHSRLLEKLGQYSRSNNDNMVALVQMRKFIITNDDCFERSNTAGHLTGSSWIVSRDYSKTLLTHHRKLDLWIQCGGHADGNEDLLEVANQEALEETGLKSLELVSDDIFDIDVHLIPAQKGVPEHYHYDVRYLFTADDTESPVVSHESIALGWLTLPEVKNLRTDDSVLRMAEKTAGS